MIPNRGVVSVCPSAFHRRLFLISHPVNVRALRTYHSLRRPHPLPCGPFCGVAAQRNLSSCHLQTPLPPVYFLSVRGGDVRRHLSAALSCCNHSLVIRSFILQTSVEGLHCLCGHNCRSLECAVAEQPRERNRQCPTRRASPPEQRANGFW